MIYSPSRHSGSYKKRFLSLALLLISLSVIGCQSQEKKESQLPFTEEKRAELPILIQFDESREYDAKALLVTFYSGENGKEKRADREYAKFPILVGTGARAKELELEGTVTVRESLIRSERKEILLTIEGNKISHNCGLGIVEDPSKTGKKAFRSVKIFFRPTGERDYPLTGISWGIGAFTYFLYPLITTGFFVEKMDCGLLVEG